MSNECISRRAVVRAGAVSLAAAALVRVRPAAGILGANERIRVGVIGLGPRGRSLMVELLERHRTYGAELTAVCDLWSEPREQAAALARARTGKRPAAASNTDELYNSDLVDAVIIATPDFSHATLSLEAVGAGMDVYVEPPAAHAIEEARCLRDAARRMNRIVQAGSRPNADHPQGLAGFRATHERCGSPAALEFDWRGYDPNRWRRDALVARLQPGDTDWRRYQLHLSPRPFDPRCYLESRLFWPYSSGLPDRWLSGALDLTAGMTGELYPSSCTATGSIFCWHDGRWNPDALRARFEYPSGLQVRCEAAPFGRTEARTVRLVFESASDNPIDETRRQCLADGECNIGGGDGERAEDRCVSRDTDRLSVWLDRVRTRRDAGSALEAAYAQAVGVNMAVRALHGGRRVSYDPLADRII